MRVLHVIHNFLPCVGGMEAYLYNLCKYSRKSGIECSVVCLNKCPQGTGKLKAHETIDGIKVERIPYVDLGIYKFAPSVLKKVLNSGADILHIHGIGFFSDFLSLTKPIHKKPIVLSTHGGIFHTKAHSRLKDFYFNNWEKMIARNFDVVAACSKNDYALFKKISKNIVLIENGMDYKFFSGAKNKAKPNTFIYVGRISKNKRVDLLIEAIAIVQHKIPNVKLTIAGEDFENLLPNLKKMVNEKNLQKNVQFAVGKFSPEEVRAFYASSEFFVSASQYEGFGISAIEAMASGCVPILNDIDSFRDFIKRSGAGFIVNFENPEAAAKTILNATALSKKQKEKLRANGKDFAGEFDWNEKVKEFGRIYSSVRAFSRAG